MPGEQSREAGKNSLINCERNREMSITMSTQRKTVVFQVIFVFIWRKVETERWKDKMRFLSKQIRFKLKKER